MMKKSVSVLLIFILTLQMVLPALIVSADEVNDTTNPATEPSETLVDEDATAYTDEDEPTTQVNDNHLDEERDEMDDSFDEALEDEEDNEETMPVQISDIFPDPALAYVIAAQLEIDIDAYISRKDLSAIAMLTAAVDSGIRTIEGLQYLRNLEVLRLGSNQITDISPLAGLTNLYQLGLSDNEISDISSLARLVNLEQLSLNGNQITDLRPLADVYMYIQDLDVQDQNITLPAVNFGEGTELESFLPDGTRVENFQDGDDLYYKDGMIIWSMSGMNQTTFSVTNPFPFSVIVHQEVFEREIAPAPDMPRLSQISIDLMYAFIANNSEENPFTVPAGLTFNEAINTLDWGAGVTVQTPMSGLQAPKGTIWGGLTLQLNVQEVEDGTYIFDDSYWFVEIGLFVQFESDDDLQDGAPTMPTGFVPQMGSAAANTMLAGLGILAVGGIVAYRKRRKG